MWSPPHPDTRIEEHRSWLRRRRDARTGPVRVRRATATGTHADAVPLGPVGLGPVASQPATVVDATGGGSTFADTVVSAAAGLAKGAIGFQVILMATVAAGQFWFGGPAMVITGHSMEPSITVGSTILTSPTTATGPMPGDIVSFDIDGSTVTHRVIDRDGDELTTRGDANASADSTPISLDEVIATASVVVPFVGLPNLWLRTRAFIPAAFWFGANALALLMIGIDKKRARSGARRAADSERAPVAVRTPVPHRVGRADLATGRIPRLPANVGS